ncbi:hypothetical protein AJ88_19465 [Mesorhizobium amorphae CCBAU 01583]|nr:hypothetical protein AJ88_19465 [Mesorhizobium amorphae CCBAU 01583]
MIAWLTPRRKPQDRSYSTYVSDGDICVQRMAAIGYGETGTAIIVMDKSGQLRCASINGDSALLEARSN